MKFSELKVGDIFQVVGSVFKDLYVKLGTDGFVATSDLYMNYTSVVQRPKMIGDVVKVGHLNLQDLIDT